MTQFSSSIIIILFLLCRLHITSPFSPRLPALPRVNQHIHVSQIEDDGYSLSKRPWKDFLSKMNFLKNPQPGTLILVRHGETTLNYNKTFTGWIDVDLSDRGKIEVEYAARLLLERGYNVDVTYTSRLKRAIRSSWIILKELGQIYRPVFKSYRLNERMYGDLEGKSKPQTCREFGEEEVQKFRRGLYARPPPMKVTHPNWHATEKKYQDLDPSEIPVTESLLDTMQRSLPLLNNRIIPDIKAGKTVMVVAHANSLRGIVKHIDNLSEEEIIDVGIPNGIPLIFKFKNDGGKLKPIPQPMAVPPVSGEFLEKKGLLRLALQREAELRARVPGFDPENPVTSDLYMLGVSVPPTQNPLQSNGPSPSAPTLYVPPVDPVVKGLTRLGQQRALIKLIDQRTSRPSNSSAKTSPEAALTSSKTDSFKRSPSLMMMDTSDPGSPATSISTASTVASMSAAPPSASFQPSNAPIGVANELGDIMPHSPKPSDVSARVQNLKPVVEPVKAAPNPPTAASLPLTTLAKSLSKVGLPVATISSADIRKAIGTEEKSPYIVIIRHGKTEYNKLGLFTGWEDVPLAEEGRIEARNAGKLLKLHGIEFDVVYTSWLSRAIETAWLVLDELDLLWLPIIKTWRLNERMYGALTGLSKSMIKERHGTQQFRQWRRSYGTRPPPISSFSAQYPGNDDRYVSNVVDIRISLFESLIRSIGHRKLELHRKFPKTESLKDCMQRTIPYFRDVILPDSIAQGKNVLIASSENAIRGLLMYLCEIPTDRIHEVEIPTGLPLVFNVNKKCIQLLDDGTDSPERLDDPLYGYDFGSSPELLFKPCDTEESEECFLGPSGKTYAFDPLVRLPNSSKPKMQIIHKQKASPAWYDPSI